MLWHAMPPEANTALLMAGAGPAPMLQAAMGWQALAGALRTQAQELATLLVSLKASWSGASAERAIAAVMPMVTWLQEAAEHAQQRGMRAAAQAAAYAQALGMTPSLPEIAQNKVTNVTLKSTNFLGINMVPIGLNETDYFVRMWTQAGTSMDVYEAQTAVNTTFEPIPPPKPILQPTMGEAVEAAAMSRLSEMAAQSAPGAVRLLADEAGEELATMPVGTSPIDQIMQFFGGMGQMSGPMQQMMQPLQQMMQQMTSLAGQTGGMGGLGDSFGGAGALGEMGKGELGQIGLVGASPVSNHPLAGGLGPSKGFGMMHAEALPGASGSEARTSLMGQLIDKPGQAVAPAGGGAGSSAMGGAAPMGAMGAGAGSGASARPAQGLTVAALPAQQGDEGPLDEFDDQDDW